MTDFPPTPEQQAIIDFAVQNKRNLIVEARAGAAKTTTLEMLARAMPSTDMLYLAFNKSVQKEASERLPQNCDALTLHSLGRRAWAQMVPSHVRLDDKKTSGNIKEVLEGLTPDERKEFEQEQSWDAVMEGLRFAKQCGWVPDNAGFKSAKPLCDDFDFFQTRLEFRASPLEEHIIREAHLLGIRQALAGQIDFDDMIFMPAIWPAHFPHYTLVLGDEVQDWSLIQHRLIEKLCKKSRIIAVGDPCQSIYGFRGAHQDSMDLLAGRFDMARLYLTTSFRCPRKVVELARSRAPDMQYPDWAAEGEVHWANAWNQTNVPDGAVIICRNNAPLLRMAFILLGEGRYPKLANGDVLASLSRIMRKLGKDDVRQAQALLSVDKWERREKKKSRYPARITDRAECMRIFIKRTDTLGAAIKKVNELKNQEGRIYLTTGHKAKGGEWDNVFFLDPDLINLEEEQERNLNYVIITRSKMSLTFVESDQYEREEE